MRVVLVTILSLCFLSAVLGSACTDACDTKYAGRGELITFCSANDETFTAYQVSLHPVQKTNSSCYARCGVAIKHVGVCGCPSGCYSDLNRGTCNNDTKSCDCAPGWSGKDCSAIQCPNTCSGHGACISQTANAGGHICQCEEGWTAYDCSVNIPSAFREATYGTLPYGELAEGGAYYKKDENKDLHQFFNTSRVATVKIWVSEENEKYLLDPLAIYQQEYVPAKLYFDNGIISRYRDVTFRIKGSSTRINPKKSWNVKFAKGDSWKKLKGFSLKSNIADRVITSQLAVEFYRSFKVQTYRSSIAELFLNDRYYGVQRLEERFDDNWFESRYDVKDVNLYKLGPYSMEYLGEDPEAYKNYNMILFDKLPIYGVEQEEGNGNFSDIAGFVSAINNNNTAIGTQYLQDHFSLKTFLRAMALETITKNADAYLSTGNNYLFTDTETKVAKKPNWEYAAYDFDVSMIPLEDSFAPVLGMTGDQLRAYMATGQTTIYGINLLQYILSSNPYDLISRPKKPLANAVFRMPGTNDTFTEYIQKFIKQVIIDSPGVTQKRNEAYYQLVRTLVYRDKMFAIMPTTSTVVGKGIETFELTHNTTRRWIEERWSYLSNLFLASGNGNCNSFGICTCKPGYYGDKCQNYCPGATFTQTKTNSWSNGNEQFSQYRVTMNVGTSPLYAVVIQAITSATSLNIWNVDKVQGSSNEYTVPKYRYTNGQLPANSSTVQFEYTISSASPATFQLKGIPCLPKPCPVSVTPTQTNSWESGDNYFQQLKLVVRNNADSNIANAKIQASFSGNTFVSQAWNIAPTSTTADITSQNFTLSLYNLQPGSVYDGCGLILSVPKAYAQLSTKYMDINSVEAICL